MKENRANVPAMFAVRKGYREEHGLPFLRRDGMTMLLAETLQILRECEVCHVCGAKSIYHPVIDRHFHTDGSDNRECWGAITRGAELKYRCH